jgi:penicillin amidase
MNRAKSCLEFKEALRLWGTPSLNTVYADAEGNIGYSQIGRVPMRSKGNGRLPVPGWTGEYEWDGFIPFDELPHLYNPPEGYIVTANNRVVDENYPHFLGNDYISANRALRIRELIEARSKVDISYIQDMHFDQLSPHARTIAGFLGRLETDDTELKLIIERMQKWDGNLRPESPEASIYQVFYRHMILQMTSNKLGDLAEYFLGRGPVPFLAEASLLGEHAYEWLEKTLSEPYSAWFIPGEGKDRDNLLLSVLRETVDELKDKLGPQVDTWHWKRLHKIRFAHALGSVKPLDRLFNRGPYPLGGDSNTIWNTATDYHDLTSDQVVGPPFRFIADLSDLDHCFSILAPGQSGSPFSRHYADQLKAWFNRGYHPMIFNRRELEKETESKIILYPAEKI